MVILMQLRSFRKFDLSRIWAKELYAGPFVCSVNAIQWTTSVFKILWLEYLSLVLPLNVCVHDWEVSGSNPTYTANVKLTPVEVKTFCYNFRQPNLIKFFSSVPASLFCLYTVTPISSLLQFPRMGSLEKKFLYRHNVKSCRKTRKNATCWNCFNNFLVKYSQIILPLVNYRGRIDECCFNGLP